MSTINLLNNNKNSQQSFSGFNLGPAIPTKDGANALHCKQAKNKASSTKPKQAANSPVKQDDMETEYFDQITQLKMKTYISILSLEGVLRTRSSQA